MIGLPFEKELPIGQLAELIESKNRINDDFDNILVDADKPEQPMRIQIKRYINKECGKTVDFFNYVQNKVCLYGEDKTLNVVVDNQTAFKLDLLELGNLLKQYEFKVGSIFVYFLRGLKPNIMELHPKYTGIYFTPE